jgi:hypothetical protein
VARLGALRELDLDHLHLVEGGIFGEARAVELAVGIAAAEVAAADFPDQVAAVLAVVARDRALAGVVEEVPARAPSLSARMALAESAPKLIAEMLKTLAE